MIWTVFQPIGKRAPCKEEAVIFDVARDAGIGLGSFCGGKGTCGKCKIRILSGRVSALTENERELFSPEDISKGYRLGCQTRVQGNVKIEIPQDVLVVSHRLQITGYERDVTIDPVIEVYKIALSPPTLDDIRSDQMRLLDYLSETYGIEKDISIDFFIQGQLPGLLRANGWQAKIGIRECEVVMAGNAMDKHLGVAVDLGTTKIAAYLTDLQTGEVLAAKGAINSQVLYGEDVISRITYAMEGGQSKLRQKAVQDLNNLIQELCEDAKLSYNDIVEAVVVGNTAMHHLFLGLPVSQLGLAPYLPAVSGPINIKARDIGLSIAPSAYIHLLPNIAGFVGADHVAMLLATESPETKKITLRLDIGTNTEVCLSVKGARLSCSCASGPAFEGAHIKDGMRATAGAIEKIQITNSTVDFRTINGESPIGLCGSGILDAVAQLRKAGVIDRQGKMSSHPSVRHSNNGKEFILVSGDKSGSGRDITLTERDISEIQLAKGAIAAGMSVLLAEARIGWKEVDEVIIAGAFGSYIDVASAIQIGMFPSLSKDRFLQVGNAAGVGAKLALISKKQRQLASNIARKIKYIELTSYPHYQKMFTQAIWLSPYGI